MHIGQAALHGAQFHHHEQTAERAQVSTYVDRHRGCFGRVNLPVKLTTSASQRHLAADKFVRL